MFVIFSTMFAQRGEKIERRPTCAEAHHQG